MPFRVWACHLIIDFMVCVEMFSNIDTSSVRIWRKACKAGQISRRLEFRGDEMVACETGEGSRQVSGAHRLHAMRENRDVESGDRRVCAGGAENEVVGARRKVDRAAVWAAIAICLVSFVCWNASGRPGEVELERRGRIHPGSHLEHRARNSPLHYNSPEEMHSWHQGLFRLPLRETTCRIPRNPHRVAYILCWHVVSCALSGLVS